MLTRNYQRILSSLLVSTLGYSEAENILKFRIEKYLDGESVDLASEIKFFHSPTFSEVTISSDKVKSIIESASFSAFFKAVESTKNSSHPRTRPNYPAVRNGDFFTVFLPEGTYKDVPYGGEFDSPQDLDEFLHFKRNEIQEVDEFADTYPTAIEPIVYRTSNHKPNEFIFVLGNSQDEYIVI